MAQDNEEAVYTLAQHSEGYAGDARLKRAVEEAHIVTCKLGAPLSEIRRVVEEGGLILIPGALPGHAHLTGEQQRGVASLIVEHENWPPELADLDLRDPHVRGTFSSRTRISGVPLYVRIEDKTTRDALWAAWLSADRMIVNQICMNAIGFVPPEAPGASSDDTW